MNDRLDKYIDQNIEEFDQVPDQDRIWGRINQELNSKERPGRFVFWQVAAVLLTLVVAYLVFDKFSNKQSSMVASQPAFFPESLQQDEFLEAEDYYTALINNKRREIQNFDVPDEVKSDFQQELEQLDSLYGQLKSEYQSVQNEQVKDAMIKNLQLRIEILNQQLSILESIQNIKENEEINT